MLGRRSAFVCFSVALLFLVAGPRAQAEVTATGRAVGATVKVLGTSLVDASDTQPQTASSTKPPSSFDADASGAHISLAPIVNVVVGPSTTAGSAAATSATVTSNAGDAVAAVLPGKGGTADVLDVVTSGATSKAALDCTSSPRLTQSGSSELNALVISGSPVPIHPRSDPNTTVLVPGLPIVIINEQICSTDDSTGTASCEVNALHAHVLNAGEVLDVVLSGAKSSITRDPTTCGDCTPVLTNSRKTSAFVTDNGQKGVPDPGDVIRYTVHAENSGPLCSTATNLTFVDRIPKNVTLDTTTIQLNGTAVDPSSFSVGNCPPDLNFGNTCPGEAGQDATRQCLTVHAGALPAKTSKDLTFQVAVNEGAAVCTPSGGNGICNTALIQIAEIANPVATPRTNIIPCPSPNPVGSDFLRTTGSGGCAIGRTAKAEPAELAPVILLGMVLAVRRRRSRRR